MQQIQFGPRITPAVKNLVIINVVVFVVQTLVHLALRDSPAMSQVEQFFALWPNEILTTGFVWQIFSYQFLHADILHLLFNMFALWMFGSELEEEWGKRDFYWYYLLSGLGAGLFIFGLPVLLGQNTGPTLGASGAIFGILLAYAVHWPERYLLFLFVFPVKVKYFVLIIGAVSLYFTFISSHFSSISHTGHLGGLITGYLLLLYRVQRRGDRFFHSSWNILYRWRLAKQKKLWMQRQRQHDELVNMEEKVDSLLEKISRHGMKSLSSEEKKFLRRASQNLNSKTDKPNPFSIH